MADEISMWDELVDGEILPPSEDDSEDEPLSALRTRQQTDSLSEEEPLINAVKRKSLKTANERQKELLIHQTVLDNILASNGFVRVPVKADGNCFFEAAASQIEATTPAELRGCLCDLLEENRHDFIKFFENTCGDDDIAREANFVSSVHDLRHAGRWRSSVADLLPLALAEWTQRQVIIFTSNEQKPKIDVIPLQTPAGTCIQPIITLALFQCYPQHYDACISVADHHVEQASVDAVSSTSGLSQDSASTLPGTPQTLYCSQTPPGSPGVPQRQSTPRKQGKFSTPPNKKLFRKRTARPETWKKNIRKALKLQGKAHVSQCGKVISEKKVHPVDCSKCRFACKNITEEERETIFGIFYALPTYDRQKQFVCSNIDQHDTHTFMGKDQHSLPKKRSVARSFYFTVKDKRVRVCKKFFLATLNVGEGYVHHAVVNSDMATFTGDDGRGKHRAHNRTHNDTVEYVKDHIRSFPCVESHYTRKDTMRHYLDASLSVMKMYHLYKETCADLSFHKPKKDQCVTCVNYTTKKKQGLTSEEEENQYQRHTEMKIKARREKAQDKDLAKKDPTIHVVTLDLQAVLPAPCGLVSQLYYKRKLSVYNFTVYSLADGKATCFVWDETNGKRGSVEIATCLFMYLQSLPVTVTDVILYSDCCSGQNRNQYLATAFLYALETIPHIVSVTHKYLETGHTQMECDSMHSAISFVQKASPVFTPSGYDIVIRMARRTNPYVVIPLRFTQILDFKHLASQVIRNTKVDKEGKRVRWLQIRAIQFTKGQDVMYFKYDFDESDFHQLCLSTPSAKRRRPPLAEILKTRYSAKLPVSDAKKNDLLSLCRSGVIPEEHHAFFERLPTVAGKTDRLDELDIEDDDGEETD